MSRNLGPQGAVISTHSKNTSSCELGIVPYCFTMDVFRETDLAREEGIIDSDLNLRDFITRQASAKFDLIYNAIFIVHKNIASGFIRVWRKKDGSIGHRSFQVNEQPAPAYTSRIEAVVGGSLFTAPMAQSLAIMTEC